MEHSVTLSPLQVKNLALCGKNPQSSVKHKILHSLSRETPSKEAV